MADGPAEIAQLLLREGALRTSDPEHSDVRQALMGHAELFEDVRRRLAAVGYRLVERLGHIGVTLDPATAHLGRIRNQTGMNAGHIRLIVYLWTHLVYREWTDLRRDTVSAAPGQAGLGLDDGGDDSAVPEPPWIAWSHVRSDLLEIMSPGRFKGLMRALQRWRFVRYDEKLDRISADASLYTLVDLHGMEDFVTGLARRLGMEGDAEGAVAAVATGSSVTASDEDADETGGAA